MARGALSLVALVVLTVFAGCFSDDPIETPEPIQEPLGSYLLDGWVPEVRAVFAAVEHSVATGEAVNVSAHGTWDLSGLNAGFLPARSVPTVWQRSSLVTNATFFEINGTALQPEDVPEFHVYEGHVDGDPARTARLVITKEWASGSIEGLRTAAPSARAALVIRVHMDGNLPVYTPPTEAAANATEEGPEGASGNGSDDAPRSGASVARSMDAYPWLPNPDRIDPPSWYDDAADDNFCVHPAPNPATPVHEVASPAAGMDPIHVKILLDGDRALMDMMGHHAMPWMVAQLAENDVIYEDQVNIRYEIVGVHLNDNKTTYGPPDEANPLGPLADYWNARDDVDRDIVHFITGHESGFAQANCIGGAGKPETAYTFTPAPWARDYGVFHVNALAHELGHIWSAHHHYGNHAETHLATIMIQGYTPGIVPVFSTLSKSVIRGWAEAHIE